MSSGLLAGRNSSCRTVLEASRIARALIADEVSTTKITVGPDEATVAALVLDGDHCGVRADCLIDPIAPLDDHRSCIQQLIEAEVAQLVTLFEPVQVDVRELQAAWIDADELEGRTRHRRRRSHASGDPTHKCGLARAELAPYEDQIALAQAPAQLFAYGLSLVGRRGLKRSGRSHAPGARNHDRPRRSRGRLDLLSSRRSAACRRGSSCPQARRTRARPLPHLPGHPRSS